jgi:chloride channel protein, CIC family
VTTISQLGRRVVHMPAVWRLRVLQRLARWGVREETLLIVMAVLVGFAAAGAAWFFEKCVDLLEWYYFRETVRRYDLTGRWIWFLPLLPAVGGVLVSVVRTAFGQGNSRIHGLSSVMLSLIKNSGRLKHWLGAETLLASSLTIGTGGSAGPEAPIAIIGSSIGSSVAALAGISRMNSATLIGCGAAAGISAVFDAPIAGVLFALEVMLRDFSVKTFTPIVISAVISTTSFHAINNGSHGEVARGLFEFQGDVLPIAFSLREIPSFLLLGILCGGLAILFTAALDWIGRAFSRIGMIPHFFHPAIGALLSGFCGVGLMLFLFHSGYTPAASWYVPIFASGYPTIMRMLDPGNYAHGAVHFTWAILVLLCLSKLVASSFTMGSGGSGGVFAPSLFIGAAAGGALGLGLRDIFGLAQPSTYALVGMGAVLAAIIQAPLMSIILLFELTRNYQVMLPIMIAAVSATVLYRSVLGESVYVQPLRKMGIRAGSAVGIAALQRIGIDQLPLKPAPIAHTGETLAEILKRMQVTAFNDFVVIDEQARYLGMLTATDLRTVLLAPESAQIVLVGEVVRSDVPPLRASDTLEDALNLISRYDVQELAVIDDDTARAKIRGVIGRADVMKRYHDELG